MRISVVKGDITDCEADAIVNAANNHLWMGSGVAGAIKEKGGTEIEEEAVGMGPIPVGEAVATRAGRLKARFVIHAAGMGQDLTPTEESIRSSTRNSLKRADELGLASLAFPLIGCGVGGFPVKSAASIMLDEVLDFASRGTTVEQVIFALYSQQDHDQFRDVLKQKSN